MDDRDGPLAGVEQILDLDPKLRPRLEEPFYPVQDLVAPAPGRGVGDVRRPPLDVRREEPEGEIPLRLKAS